MLAVYTLLKTIETFDTTTDETSGGKKKSKTVRKIVRVRRVRQFATLHKQTIFPTVQVCLISKILSF